MSKTTLDYARTVAFGLSLFPPRSQEELADPHRSAPNPEIPRLPTKIRFVAKATSDDKEAKSRKTQLSFDMLQLLLDGRGLDLVSLNLVRDISKRKVSWAWAVVFRGRTQMLSEIDSTVVVRLKPKYAVLRHNYVTMKYIAKRIGRYTNLPPKRAK